METQFLPSIVPADGLTAAGTVMVKFISHITWRPGQDGRRLGDTFKYKFVDENILILIKSLLGFVPKGSMNNIPALVQIMAWYRPATSHYLNRWLLVYYIYAYVRQWASTVYIYIYIYMCVCVCVCMYIYAAQALKCFSSIIAGYLDCQPLKWWSS